jgi:hypothetical protein
MYRIAQGGKHTKEVTDGSIQPTANSTVNKCPKQKLPEKTL